MDLLDCEVVILPHFKHVSNREMAQLLDLKMSTAIRRSLCALDRLREILRERPDIFG